MKTLTDHQINECNQAIKLEADEPDEKNGGASHRYSMTVTNQDGQEVQTTLHFQRGPIKEVGTNGITHEVLLAILIDRMRGFQLGPYANEWNARALAHFEGAQEALHERTKARVARGVEGTNVV